MDKNYREEDVFNKAISLAPYNSLYTFQLFKKYFKCSPYRYITDTRINAAKSLLISGKKVKEVAFDCGYNDFSYFSRIFKKHTGQSPTSYVA